MRFEGKPKDATRSRSLHDCLGWRVNVLTFVLVTLVIYLGTTSLTYSRVSHDRVGTVDQELETTKNEEVAKEAVTKEEVMKEDVTSEEVTSEDTTSNADQDEEKIMRDESDEEPTDSSAEERIRTYTKKVEIVKLSDFPPEPPSPFELRYPGYKRPKWAAKPFFFRRPIPDDKRVCFVHIGKAAGSTMGCFLGFQLHCDNTKKYPTGLLPKYTSNAFHNGVNDCPFDPPPAYYLFSARHPLERIQSAYVYDRIGRIHDEERLYKECPFYTLNKLAENGLAKDGKANAVCKERAFKAVRGIERFGYHLYYNYEYYMAGTLTDDSKQVLVIRTEHMEEDWNSAEAVLGGNPKGVKFPERNKNAKKLTDDNYLSEKSTALLCDALCDEIQRYKRLLARAVNLTPEQVKESIDELAQTCPKEVAVSSCSKL